MIEINCDQYSADWWDLRRGIPTASEFGRIVSPKECKYSKDKADTYIASIIAGALGWKKDDVETDDIKRGRTLESQALRWLGFRHGIKSRKVGFCLDGSRGSSPDSMVLDSIVPIEVKAPDLHTLIGWKMEGTVPEKHVAQCHGHMIVTGADTCLFVGYAIHPSVDNMLIEVKRNDYTSKLEDALSTFAKRLSKAEEIALEENVHEYREGLIAKREAVIAKYKTPNPEEAAA